MSPRLEAVPAPLKPCPFCGGKAKVHFIGGIVWGASCLVCRSAGQTGRSQFEAVALWNRRTPPRSPHQVKAIERARAKVARIKMRGAARRES